ncbi:hypothetical protein OHB33_01125 [Streptomyces sp. NBC_01558]|nr:hypothetical protein [Streptomyces sp. NBC_01558]WSD82114.1 hypothetical protein OHB33_01125 [Streptomyces sp. NBC_01558]
MGGPHTGLPVDVADLKARALDAVGSRVFITDVIKTYIEAAGRS